MTEDFAARVRANQQRQAASSRSRYDYIVCGAGSAGCVVAARLAADPAIRVLLVEAGGTDDCELVMDPNRWPDTLGSALDWGFVVEANPNLNGRSLPYSMGKVLGGGSSINVSTWSRGHRADWNAYAAESDEASWAYPNVLDLYRERIEDWVGDADPEYRGSHGAVRVQPAAAPSEFALALLQAASAVGLPQYPNPNGRMMEAPGGCALVDETISDRRRRSIFRSYVYPLMHQANLTVLTSTSVSRIMFEGRRASGIEVVQAGQTLRFEAQRELILSLGAIHTPKLLLLSGIGDPAELARANIPVRQALPGVGRNLHDHVSIACIWELKGGGERLGIPRSQTACFWKTDSDLDSPNCYAYSAQRAIATPELAARSALPEQSWSLALGMRPWSRGSIHVTGSKLTDPVRIVANQLDDARDMRHLIVGLDMVRAIGNSKELRAFTGHELAPGPPSDMVRFIRDGLTTFWHQSGTAKMGRDSMSVVDGKLRVHGLDNLRIADASILPRVTSGNTMAPCVVIGEQAAKFLFANAS